MRRAMFVAKFAGVLVEHVLQMVKARRLPRRGSGPLGLIKRILAQWQFTQAEVSPPQMVNFLTSAETEEINATLNQLKSHSWLAEYCRDPLYLVEYLLVRVAKPETVVETGVADGYSSAIILQALEDNDLGQLYSIDLPPVGEKLPDGAIYILPSGKQVGWAVPQTLHRRWHLILGDAFEKLPSLLQDLGKIDIFIHDSLHTEKHMMFEYETAWLFIRQGGVLLSDDIGVSFNQFSRKVKRPLRYVKSLERHIGGITK